MYECITCLVYKADGILKRTPTEKPIYLIQSNRWITVYDWLYTPLQISKHNLLH